MKSRTNMFIEFSLFNLVQIFLIVLPILICLFNLKGSSMYDPDNLMVFGLIRVFPYGVIFIIPLIYFLIKDKKNKERLIIIDFIVYIILAESVGWILNHPRLHDFSNLLQIILESGLFIFSCILFIFLTYVIIDIFEIKNNINHAKKL